MPQLIKGRAVVEDRWTLLRDVASLADLAEGVPVIVPLAFWLDHRDGLLPRGDVGVWLAPSDDLQRLAADLDALPVIAVDFPKFTDGRGYSIARFLRDRHRFTGELRAVGDVLRDQLFALAECGFDAFALRDGRDARRGAFGIRRLRRRLHVDVAHATAMVSPAQFQRRQRFRSQHGLGPRSGRRARRGIIRRQVRVPQECGRTAARILSQPPAIAAGRPMPLPLFRLPHSPSATGWRRHFRVRLRPRREIFRTAFACRGAKARPRTRCGARPARQSPRGAAGSADATQRRTSRPRWSDQLPRRPRRTRRRIALRRPRCARRPRKSDCRRRRSPCWGNWPNTKP